MGSMKTAATAADKACCKRVALVAHVTPHAVLCPCHPSCRFQTLPTTNFFLKKLAPALAANATVLAGLG